jgi:hypothetical protein
VLDCERAGRRGPLFAADRALQSHFGLNGSSNP